MTSPFKVIERNKFECSDVQGNSSESDSLKTEIKSDLESNKTNFDSALQLIQSTSGEMI